MIRVQLVDPDALPPRIPGVAIHRAGDITFLMDRTLDSEQLASWMCTLGAQMTREAVDATVARSQAAAQPPLRM